MGIWEFRGIGILFCIDHEISCAFAPTATGTHASSPSGTACDTQSVTCLGARFGALGWKYEGFGGGMTLVSLWRIQKKNFSQGLCPLDIPLCNSPLPLFKRRVRRVTRVTRSGKSLPSHGFFSRLSVTHQ